MEKLKTLLIALAIIATLFAASVLSAYAITTILTQILVVNHKAICILAVIIFMILVMWLDAYLEKKQDNK